MKNEMTERNQLEWLEPWPALDSAGNEVIAHVTLRASAQDCINMARHAAASAGHTNLSDDELLQSFMAIHWAANVGGDL